MPLTKNYCPSISEDFTVDHLQPQQEGIIKELPDKSLLACLGLRPGKPVQLLTRQKFGGPLVIKMNGRCVAISRSLARRIKLTDDGEPRTVVEADV